MYLRGIAYRSVEENIGLVVIQNEEHYVAWHVNITSSLLVREMGICNASPNLKCLELLLI